MTRMEPENDPTLDGDGRDDPRYCGVCGEDVVGTDFIAIERWLFFREGKRGDQVVIAKDENEEFADEFLHRHCISIFCDMQFTRLHNPSQLPGDTTS